MAIKTIDSNTAEISYQTIGLGAQSSQPSQTTELANRVMEHLQTWHFSHRQLVTDIQHLQSKDLNQLLKEVVNKVIENFSENHGEDPMILMHRLADIVPLDVLRKAVLNKYPTIDSALEDAKKQLRTAQFYLTKTGQEIPVTVKSVLTSILDKIIAFIESILGAFGVEEFFKRSESAIEKDIKSQRIMMLLGMFTLLTATLLPMLGVTTGAEVIGGTMLGIAVLSVIYPTIRPAPKRFSGNSKNLTDLCRKGKLPSVEGRPEVIQKIVDAISCTNDGNKGHPFVLGQSRAGKTKIIEGLVWAIERGYHPELKGKQVIYCSMASLVNSKDLLGGGNKILQRFVEEMGRYRDNYIFVFDEFHEIYKTKEGLLIAGQLLTYLEQEFPHVIALTTDEDYVKYILPNLAMANRFDPILVENPKPRETCNILRGYLLQQAPATLIAKNALEYLVEETSQQFPDHPQPAMAVNILSRCITQTSGNPKSENERRIEEIRREMHARAIEGVFDEVDIGEAEEEEKLDHENLSSEPMQLEEMTLDALEAELNTLVSSIEQRKNELGQLSGPREMYLRTRKKTFQMTEKISKLQKDHLSARDRRQLGEYLLVKEMLSPALQRQIVDKGHEVRAQVVVDKALIDKTINERQEKDKLKQKILEKGAARMNNRLQMQNAQN